MNTSKILRLSLVAAAFAAALSAHAVYIGINSHGATTDDGANINDTVDFMAGGYGLLSALHYSFIPTDVGTYTGTGGTLDFSFNHGSAITNGGAVTYSGTWTATGGTGTYLGATGSGTIATTFYNIVGLSGNTLTIFAGDVQAVPEPAPFAALGLGAVALLRCRRPRA